MIAVESKQVECIVWNDQAQTYLLDLFSKSDDYYIEHLSLLKDKLKRTTDHLEKSRIHSKIGQLQSSMGVYSESISHFRTAIMLSPEEHSYYLALASTLLGNQDYLEAVAILEAGLKLKPNDLVIKNLIGVAQNGLNQVPKSIKTLLEVVGEDPKMGEGYYNLGSIYFQKSQYSKAFENFEKCLNCNPNNVQAFYKFSQICQKISKEDSAFSLLENALAKGSQNISGSNYFYLGHLYFSYQNYAKAVENYRKAKQLGVICCEVEYSIGMCELFLKNIKQAQMHLKLSTEMNKSIVNSKPACGYAICLIHMQQYDEAVNILYRLLRRDPQNYQAAYNLGLALRFTPKYQSEFSNFTHLVDSATSNDIPFETSLYFYHGLSDYNRFFQYFGLIMAEIKKKLVAKGKCCLKEICRMMNLIVSHMRNLIALGQADDIKLLRALLYRDLGESRKAFVEFRQVVETKQLQMVMQFVPWLVAIQTPRMFDQQFQTLNSVAIFEKTLWPIKSQCPDYYFLLLQFYLEMHFKINEDVGGTMFQWLSWRDPDVINQLSLLSVLYDYRQARLEKLRVALEYDVEFYSIRYANQTEFCKVPIHFQSIALNIIINPYHLIESELKKAHFYQQTVCNVSLIIGGKSMSSQNYQYCIQATSKIIKLLNTQTSLFSNVNKEGEKVSDQIVMELISYWKKCFINDVIYLIWEFLERYCRTDSLFRQQLFSIFAKIKAGELSILQSLVEIDQVKETHSKIKKIQGDNIVYDSHQRVVSFESSQVFQEYQSEKNKHFLKGAEVVNQLFPSESKIMKTLFGQASSIIRTKTSMGNMDCSLNSRNIFQRSLRRNGDI